MIPVKKEDIFFVVQSFNESQINARRVCVLTYTIRHVRLWSIYFKSCIFYNIWLSCI